jgi:predicted nucleotidyltransferase component of viral defense system
MPKPVTNIAASVRQRLSNLARERELPFQLMLIRYALERLLYRVSISRYRDRFILKGAMLVTSWIDAPFRATRDLDFLAFGDQDPAALRDVFLDILSITDDDGLVFPTEMLVADVMREDAEYRGLRIRALALLDSAKIPIVVDLGFGDRMVPEPEEITYPVLLDHAQPKLRAYAIETVIAEKFQAMVMLGRANSRMKDLYDIWMLSRSEKLDRDRLAQATAATFAQRNTAIPFDPPDALTPAFAADEKKQKEWAGFVQNNLMGGEGSDLTLADIIVALTPFLMTIARDAETLVKSRT